MTLQSSGQISLNDLHVEAGGNSGTQAGMNDTDIRGLINKSSGATMSFNEWYGASNIVPLTFTHQWTGYRHNTGGSYNYGSMYSGGSVQAGDFILFNSVAYSLGTTPTGFTTISSGYAGYSVVYYNSSYRIATSAETSVSGFASNTSTIVVSVYRPSGTINTVTPTVSTTSSNSGTINASNASTNHIFFANVYHDDEESLTLANYDGQINSGNGWGDGQVTTNTKVGHQDGGGSYGNKSFSIWDATKIVYGYIEISG